MADRQVKWPTMNYVIIANNMDHCRAKSQEILRKKTKDLAGNRFTSVITDGRNIEKR